MNPKQQAFDSLGKIATDRVTGFVGVITSISFDLYGCVQALLTARLGKEKPKAGDSWVVPSFWMDFKRLTIAKTPVMEVPNFETVPGPEPKPCTVGLPRQ